MIRTTLMPFEIALRHAKARADNCLRRRKTYGEAERWDIPEGTVLYKEDYPDDLMAAYPGDRVYPIIRVSTKSGSSLELRLWEKDMRWHFTETALAREDKKLSKAMKSLEEAWNKEAEA